MLNRRTFLGRLPLAPVAVTAMVTQAPALLSRLAQPAATMAPLVQREQPLESRLEQFAQEAVPWLEQYRPGMQLPGQEAVPTITLTTMRAIVQWEQFAGYVVATARNYNVPLDRAFELARVPLSLLP